MPYQGWTLVYKRPVYAGATPPPTLMLNVNPVAPTLLTPVSNGQVVATLNATWSDSSPFTGTFAFVAPNFDHGGDYAISGSNLVVNNAANINALGSVTVEHVTIVAQQ